MASFKRALRSPASASRDPCQIHWISLPHSSCIKLPKRTYPVLQAHKNSSCQFGTGRQNTGFIYYFRNLVLLPVGHNVNTGNTVYLADLLYELDTDSLAFFARAGGLFHTVYQGIRDMNARYIRAHPACCAGRGQWPDASQNEDLFVQSHFAHPRHKILK